MSRRRKQRTTRRVKQSPKGGRNSQPYSNKKRLKQGHTEAIRFPLPEAHTKVRVDNQDSSSRNPVELVDIPYGELNHPGSDLPITPDIRNAFYKQNRALGTLKICLAPECSSKPADIIASHSISKSQILNRLAVNGQVWAPNRDYGITNNGETLMTSPFKRIGINKATTFSGLCGLHDQKIFRILDTKDVNIDNPEYLFKLAYRALLKELYNKLIFEKMSQSQPIFLEHSNTNSLIDGATFQLRALQYLKQYKIEIDHSLIAEEWNEFSHTSYILEGTSPTVAVSGFVSLDDIDRFSNAKAAYSILPTDQGVVAIFSSRESDYPTLQEYLNRNLSAPPRSRRFQNELSVLILRDTDNFIVSPRYWDSLSQERQKQIIRYFLVSTEELPPQHHPSKKLNLFQYIG